MNDEPHESAEPEGASMTRRSLIGATTTLTVTAVASAISGPVAASGAPEPGAGDLRVPARAIPIPRTISAEAQQFLSEGTTRLNAMMAAGSDQLSSPPPHDKAAWKARI